MSGSKHVNAAVAVFEELGVETMSTRDLVRAAIERDLIGDAKWAYNHMSRKVRDSSLFDTSVRGQVTFLGSTETLVEEVEVAPEAPVTPVASSFPGPTLGGATAGASIVVTDPETSVSTDGEEAATDFEVDEYEATETA